MMKRRDQSLNARDEMEGALIKLGVVCIFHSVTTRVRVPLKAHIPANRVAG